MYEPVSSQNSSDWFYDLYTDNCGLLVRIKEKVAEKQTKLQHVQILDTFEFGKILVLNQYMYQAQKSALLGEMLVHVPLNTGPAKKRVLIIGGGDGVTLGQVVKHSEVQEVDVLDIDEELTQLCREKYFVTSDVWQDKRANFIFEDGFKFLQKSDKKYDAILSAASSIYNPDGSPGMAFPLYTEEFYRLAANHLSEIGLFSSDGTTVHYTGAGYRWWEYGQLMTPAFKLVLPYHFNSKRMPGGEFVLLLGSNKLDPRTDFQNNAPTMQNDYYNQEVHGASFALPQDMRLNWPENNS